MDSEETKIVNQYSLASYYVEVFFNDIKLSNATCFFTKREDKRYLITNWHVVSGKDADTLKCLDVNAAIPNKLHIYLPQKTEDNNAIFDDDFIELDLYDEEENKVWYDMKQNDQMIDIAVVPIKDEIEKYILDIEDADFIELDLYDEEENKVWYDMKQNDQMIDIAVVPIKDEIEKYILDIEDAEEPFNENVNLNIADEIFVIGFPFGRIGGILPIWKKASVASEPSLDLNDMPYYFADTATKSGMSGVIGFPFGRIGGILPIWKKASVASEPSLDLNDMPYYFADTATKSGMSGSPVILYEKRPVVIAESLQGKFSKYRTKFVGVYSGRIGANSDNKNDAQLGRVWKVDMVDKIINQFEK